MRKVTPRAESVRRYHRTRLEGADVVLVVRDAVGQYRILRIKAGRAGRRVGEARGRVGEARGR
eukprot:3400554-Rhodomonas_salina.2